MPRRIAPSTFGGHGDKPRRCTGAGIRRRRPSSPATGLRRSALSSVKGGLSREDRGNKSTPAARRSGTHESHLTAGRGTTPNCKLSPVRRRFSPRAPYGVARERHFPFCISGDRTCTFQHSPGRHDAPVACACVPGSVEFCNDGNGACMCWRAALVDKVAASPD